MTINKNVSIKQFLKGMVRGTLLLAVVALVFFSETLVNKALAYIDSTYSNIVSHTPEEAQACFAAAFNEYGLGSYGLTTQMFENLLLKESGLSVAQCAATPNVHQNGCGEGGQYSSCGWGCTQMDDGGTLQSVAGVLGYGSSEAFKAAIMTDACIAFKAGAYVLWQKAQACGSRATANTILCAYNMGEGNGCSMADGCNYSQCITSGTCEGGGDGGDGGAASGVLWTDVFGVTPKQCAAFTLPSARDTKLAALSAVSGMYPSSPEWKEETMDLRADVIGAMLFGADAAAVAAYDAARGLPLAPGTKERIVRDDHCIEKLEIYLGDGGANHTFGAHNTVNNFIDTDAFKKCAGTCKAQPAVSEISGPTSLLCSAGSYQQTASYVLMPTNALSAFLALGAVEANKTGDYSGYVFTYEGK